MQTEELLQILACPRCLGGLEALPSTAAAEVFFCPTCAVVYPVRDDIPVMLVEEAISREDWDGGRR